MVSEAWAFASNSSQQPNPLINFIFLGILFFIIWMFIIQPQKKQRQEHEKLMNELKKGDQVITQGGIHGNIVNVKNSTVILSVDDHTKIEFEKAAIIRVVPKS